MAPAARLMAGCAFLVCAMNALLRFVPGNSAAWLLALVLGALLLASWPHRSVPGAPRYLSASAAALAVVILAWRLWPQLQAGASVPIEGTGNADELWYIFSADWLRHHSLAQAFVSDPAYPLSAAAGVNIGQLPRIGAETLLVAFASWSGWALEHVYPVLFALASLLFCFAASYAYVDKQRSDWRFLPVALAVVALSPVALFIYYNGNFATMWGLVFLSGYFWNARASLDPTAEVSPRAQIIAAGLFLGAILATYPEMLAIAVPASVVLYVQHVVRRPATWWRAARTLLMCALVGVLVAPWAVFDTVRVLTTGAAASAGPNTIFPELFSSLTAFNFIATTVVFDGNALSKLGRFAPAVVGVLLLVTIGWAPRRIWAATLGLLLGCAAVFCAFWKQHYGYGGMKAIEFLALPLATLLGAAADRAATMGWQRNKTGWRSGPAVLAAGALLGVGALALIAVQHTVRYHANGTTFRLTPELAELSKLPARLPAGAVVQVGPELGPASLLTSRWIAYQLRDVALVYPPELQQGGYLYGLDANYPQRAAGVTHVLRASTGEGSSKDGAVFRNRSFEVLPVDKLPYTLGPGFHGHEGWGRWMAGTAELELRGTCSRTLHVSVDHRYANLKGEDALIVSAGAASKRFELHDGRGEIDFDIPANSSKVLLRSAADAVAPSALGGGDTRPLSYAITRMAMPACPL